MKPVTIAKIELWKLKRQRFPYVMGGIIVLVEIIFGIIRNQASSMDLMTVPTAFELTASVTANTFRVAAFMLLAFSAMTLSTEMSHGTLKTLLVKPFQRRDLIFGKALAILVVSGLVVIGVALIGVVLGAVFQEFKPLAEDDYVIHSLGVLWGNLILGFLFTILPVFALCLLGLFSSVWTESSGVSVSISVGCYLLLELLGQVKEVKSFLLGAFVSFPLNTVESMARGLPTVWSPGIYWLLGNSLIYIIIFLLLSAAIFQRKDIM